MKRTSAMMATALAVILAVFGCVSSRPSGVQAPKAGRALVKSLPEHAEGVALLGNTVQVKEGFEWVKQADGTVTVARMAGGGGVGGTWSCDCQTGAYSCSAEIDERSLRCVSRDCLSCTLVITKGGLKSPIIIY